MVGRIKAGGLILALFILVFGLPTGWCDDSQPKIAIMPFVMHGSSNAGEAQKSLDELFARLGARAGLAVIEPALVSKAAGGPVNSESQARAIGKKLGAAYVMFGDYSQVGDTISIQAKLADMSGAKKTVSLLAEQRGVENLASAVENIVDQTSADVLGKAIIAQVRFEGNQRIESAALEAVVKSKKGQLLNPRQVSEDIRAIFKMGYFEKVDADVKSTPAGKILTFVVKENPTINKLVIKGNKKVKTKDILAAISTKQYSVLKLSSLASDVQKIRKLYQQKAYYNADITTNISYPISKREAVVTFNIVEHKKVYVKSIKFIGNKQISSRTLQGEMQTKPWSLLSYVSERGTLQRDILDTDIERLNAYYHDIGFMDASVGSPTVTLEKNGFHIKIPVHEGVRYKVKSVRLSGDLISGYKTKIEKKLKTKANQYFSGANIRNDLKFIKSFYTDKGYAKADVEPMISRDNTAHTIAVDFHVQKFGVVHIGRIFITGNTKTRDYVIRRELKIAEGDTFNSKAIEDSQLALKRLDFFKSVEIVPVSTSQPNVMDLNIKVVEKQTGTISVGGGYSTLDGLFVMGQIQQKNLYGTGQYLGLQAMLAQDAQFYQLSYTKPWLFDTRFSGGFDIYDSVMFYQDFAWQTYGIKLRAGYPIGNYSNVSAYYVAENGSIYYLDSLAEKDPYFQAQQARGYQFKSGFGVAFSRNTTDQPFLPTRGTFTGATIEYDSRDLGSDYNMLKQDYHAGIYYPLFWKFVGHIRAEAGFENGSSLIPVWERYFLGGIDSMRGWYYGYLGPRDANGLVIGGNKYAVINYELLFPLLEHYGVRGLFFFDWGNAFLPGQEINPADFREDVGPGIRWNSPFGPLRIEMGYVLDRRPGDPQYEWQFSAGAFF